NGPHQNSWPDAGTTPFRSEKNTNWEGAFRVPCLIRWPGRIHPGSVSNDGVDGPRTASRCQNGDETHHQREPPMNEITTIGLDLAKHVFQVHGVDASGVTVVRKRLRRSEVLAFF